jgi:hypothetical protein
VTKLWNSDWAYQMALTPDAHLLAVGGYRGSMRLWDVSRWLVPEAARTAKTSVHNPATSQNRCP